MIENLETLIAFAQEGTMTKAATRLRITQSAVSKRLAALEREMGQAIIERRGREAVVTETGRKLIADAEPLLNELRTLLSVKSAKGAINLTIGVSESVFGSWGAGVLFGAERQTSGVKLVAHTHRSPVVVDKVRSGEYQLGLCSGLETQPSGLVGEVLYREQMVFVGSPKTLRNIEDTEVWTIEPSSLTWRSMKKSAGKYGIFPSRTVETFFGVAQAAKAGFGVGMVPIGVALAMKIPTKNIKPIEPLLERSVAIVSQKSRFNRPEVRAFIENVKQEIGRLDLDGV